MARLLLVLASLALAAALGAAPSPARATDDENERTVVVPLRVHVVDVDGEPVVDAPWLDEQLQEANRVFQPTGVSFQELERQSLDEHFADLVTRRDRNSLAQFLERGVVNVFVVASMVDVDDQSSMRRGVHWTLQWRPDNHFLVLTSIGPRTTLAHELGHYFGNRIHTSVFGNIMSYEHGPAPSLSAHQRRRVITTARHQLRSRTLFSVDGWRELESAGRLPRFFYPRRDGTRRNARR
ncbi:MAG: hypothetical protein AB8H86_18310 [Polyangiales bacterium]